MGRVWRAVLLLASVPAVAGAGELQDDLRARRARVMEAIGPESVLVHWSAPTRVFSRDVDYEYRQDSDMLYLTGIDQDGTTLVLLPGNKTKQSILFVSDADPRREHRAGAPALQAGGAGGERRRRGALRVGARRVPDEPDEPPGPGRAADRVHGGVRRLLRRAQGRQGPARTRLRPPPRREGGAAAGLRLCRAHAPARAGAADHGRDRDRVGPAPGQDALRARGAAAQRLCLGRRPPRRDAGHPARPLRVRGGGGAREGLPRARRAELGLPFDRRQRTERDDPALRPLPAPDEGGRAAADRRRGLLRGHDRGHHARLAGERHVLEGAGRAVAPGTRGAGRRDEGRRRREPHDGRREGGRGGRQGRAAEARARSRTPPRSSTAPGTRTASATGSASTCTTWATTAARSSPAWPS